MNNTLERLRKRHADDEASSTTRPKRYKTTGDVFKLRALSYFSDRFHTNDEIHQSIHLCPVMRACVDTEVFQRLRGIRQLGAAEYLYVGANHTRFQHSLGTAHLAGNLIQNIRAEQPNLGTTEKDALCIRLAGMLHDLGHGPFSHVYEYFYERALPAYLEANPELKEYYNDCCQIEIPAEWSHERSSLIMIDALLEELGLAIDLSNLDAPLTQIGDGVAAESMRTFNPHTTGEVLTSRDWVFIKECVFGKPLPEVKTELGEHRFIGRRDRHQEWMYDIVNNRHSGLDVDKIDYFARDARHCKGEGQVIFKVIQDARVAMGECSRPENCFSCLGKQGQEHYMICYPMKHVPLVMDFFTRRMNLHTSIYQHKKVATAETMLCDILCAADPFFRLQDYHGSSIPISRAAFKASSLLRLDDNILDLIAHTTEPELQYARDLRRRFRGFKGEQKEEGFYKCPVDEPLGIYNNNKDKMVWDLTEQEIEEQMLNIKGIHDNDIVLQASDFVVRKSYMHHGAQDKNPLLLARFFEELNDKLIGPVNELPVAVEVDEFKYESIIPRRMDKHHIRVVSRHSDRNKVGLVDHVFRQWLAFLGQEGPEATPALPNHNHEADDGAVHQEEDNRGLHQHLELEFPAGENGEEDDEQEGDNGARLLSQDSDCEDDRAASLSTPSPVVVRRRLHAYR